MLVLPVSWLLNSPDLNPVDYQIWGVMQDVGVDVAGLRQHFIDARYKLVSN